MSRTNIIHARYGWVITLGIAFLLFGGIFTLLVDGILHHKVVIWDIEILNWILVYSHEALERFFVLITHIGDVTVVAVIAALIMGLLLLKRRFHDAITLALLVGGSGVINVIIKPLFSRERPEIWPWLVDETGYSFPSGHSMLSAALIVGLIIISWRSRWHWAISLVGMILIFTVGISRLYLGVHYPSDVLAGWCIVGMIVCSILITEKLQASRDGSLLKK